MARLKLDNLSVSELVELRESIQVVLARKIEVEKLALRGQLESLSRLAAGKPTGSSRGRRSPGSRADTGKRGRRGRKTGKVAPKYHGPGGETWTGRGRAPRWLAALEADGKKRETYLLKT